MKKLLEKQIEITDREIDPLVYELYDLTEEETLRQAQGDYYSSTICWFSVF
ncbi:hypothetical protein ACFLSQ_09740 [Bacteroidota bacterium]